MPTPPATWQQIIRERFPKRDPVEVVTRSLYPPVFRVRCAVIALMTGVPNEEIARLRADFVADSLHFCTSQDVQDSVRYWKNRSGRCRFAIPSSRQALIAYARTALNRKDTSS